MRMNKCKVCECELSEVPMCFGGASPASLMVPDDEYADRVEENNDQCIIDGKYFFVRGHIEIPVIGTGETFIWSAWVSLSEESFIHLNENWNKEGREKSAPYFGWLSSYLPCYPKTSQIKTSVQFQAVGSVPLITVELSEHPLSKEQHSGITMERVYEIVHEIMQY